MKIVTRKEFMRLPAGTLFSYYKPCMFRDLAIKDSAPEDGSPDFIMSDLIGAFEHDSSDQFVERCEKMVLGESFPVDFEFSGREGMFDDEQLFAVYETEDVKKLISRLQGTLTPLHAN